MRISKLILLSASAVAVSSFILITSPESEATAAARDECDDTALAILEATKSAANADYWTSYANCLNDPDGVFADCESDAADALQEALDEAQEQYDARLEVCALLGGGPYDPDLDPSEFTTSIDNPYLPAITGQTYVYEKKTPEGLESVEIRATHDVVTIDGFKCRAIRDIERLDGVLVEDTVDWFAQRNDGTVWYFGEIARNYEDGFLADIDGSWRHGTDGAKAGIIMLASPAPDDFYRQEFFLNEAEDVAMVVSTSETVTVPYGTFTNCLQTEEWSPLSPGNFEWKYYAKGVGLVLEFDPSDGERLELVRIKK